MWHDAGACGRATAQQANSASKHSTAAFISTLGIGGKGLVAQVATGAQVVVLVSDSFYGYLLLNRKSQVCHQSYSGHVAAPFQSPAGMERFKWLQVVRRFSRPADVETDARTACSLGSLLLPQATFRAAFTCA
jgi:hypothetical protein